MREVKPLQKRIGQTDIADIKISTRSRDDVPDILRGLQYLYTNDVLQEQLFLSLEGLLSDNQKNLGRQGMDLWRVFVLATLRVNLNWDYDRLQHMVNEHRTIRQMLGHGSFDDDYEYSLQTLKDNVHMLTPEILDEINQAIVNAGHGLVKKKDSILRGRCDSFVVETDVHFPTDISLLFDALRKPIQLISNICRLEGMSDWRQSTYNIKQIKRAYRKAQQSTRGNSKDKEDKIIQAHFDYIELARAYLFKLEKTLPKISNHILCAEIMPYLQDVRRQIDQIDRRVLNREKIPSEEKVYSIFERHTEWNNKGKAGGAIELGVKVCLVEDQYQFLLHHRVMYKECDSGIAVAMTQSVKDRYNNFNACSFDKGFDSAKNQAELKKIIDTVIMPRKGKLSSMRYNEEHEESFIKERHQHSAVESAINCIEHHGLDKCPDKGTMGFDRYVAIAVVAKNIQRIGAILRAKSRAQEERRYRKLQKAA